MTKILWIIICAFLMNSKLFAQNLEERLSDQQSSIESLSLGSGTLGREVEEYLGILRDYEVLKLRELSQALLRSADEELVNRSSPEARAQLVVVKQAFDLLDRTLDQISGLSLTPSDTQNYAKSWHGIIVRRNSSFRAFVRELLIFFRITRLGEGRVLARAKLKLLTHAEHTHWALQLIPYLRSVSGFFLHFFKEVQHPYTPHFTPELHRVLDMLGRGQGMKVKAEGFDEESKRRLQQKGLHVWVMNHRNIYLDPFFVSQILKIADCSWDCHYAVDPFRYFGGNGGRISSRMTEMPDFLPVGDEAGAAIRRAKEIAAQSSRANVFIFPEATTSLMGDTALLDPYFVLSFIRSLKRLNLEHGVHFHIVSTDVQVQPRVNFRQRLSEYFRPGDYEEVTLRYHGSISSDEMPRRIGEDDAFDLNTRIWAAFHRAQQTDSGRLHGQLRPSILRQSLQRMFNKELACKDSLPGFSTQNQ